jgi:hypothetical protein
MEARELEDVDSLDVVHLTEYASCCASCSGAETEGRRAPPHTAGCNTKQSLLSCGQCCSTLILNV